MATLAFTLVDVGIRLGMIWDREAKDPYRLAPLGDLNAVQFDDGSVGLQPSQNPETLQVKWLNDYLNIYQKGVSDWNQSLNDFVQAQKQQDIIDKQDIAWLNQQKQIAWEETQAVYAEEARLIAQRQEEIRVGLAERESLISALTIDRANEKSLEKLGLFGTALAPPTKPLEKPPTAPPSPRDSSVLLLIVLAGLLLR